MGLFDKLFSKNDKPDRKQGDASRRNIKSGDVIQTMLVNAKACLDDDRPEQAFDLYKSIVEMALDTTAQYNLGSLYAQGKGTEQDFLQAAYWFHQAVQNGEPAAEKMRTKSTMDYLHQDFDQTTARQLYEKMIRYASLLYPRDNRNTIVAENLYNLGAFHFNKKEYKEAAKLFRSGAEFANHGESQNYLAVLYNAGLGVEKDDIAALYWFDRATDNGVEVSKKDRDGILNAYYENFSPEKFYDTMDYLVKACVSGSEEIPQDQKKAKYWRKQCEQLLKGRKEQEETKQAVPKKTLEELVQICLDYLIEKRDDERQGVTFPVPGTGNIARLYAGPVDKRKNSKWHYTVGVCKDGTDMMVSHYLKSGTREEVCEYVKTEENKSKTIESVKKLSDNVDERWS